jgi:putative ABC transport system permease protein
MSVLRQDLRYAIRALGRNPGFSIVAILTLALGIGANTAVFSVVQAVLLRPLPFRDAGQLVQLWETGPWSGPRGPVSPYNFEDWRRDNRSLPLMAAYGYESFTLTGGAAAERLTGLRVTSGFFPTLGAGAERGRTFVPDDDRPDSRVAVLSHAAWLRRFGGAGDIVGRTIILNDEPYAIVGVMPATFAFPSPRTEIWTAPAYELTRKARGSHYLFAIGRMAPSVTLARAQSELDAVAARLAVQFPESNAKSGVLAVPLREELVGNLRFALLVLWGAVAMVLLIAAANAANLLLVRAAARQRETAIRAALGASLTRLVRQLLTESLVLAAIGGALGVALAAWGTRLILATGGRVLPGLVTVRVDPAVLGFTALITVLTGLLFGTAPALWHARAGLRTAARAGGGLAGGGRSGTRLRFTLAAAEIAVALMLVVGAGLLLQSFWRLRHVDTGFDPSGMITLRISVSESRFPESARRARFYQAVADRIAAIPGVTRVGAVNDLPFSGSRTTSSFAVETGGQPLPPDVVTDADHRTVNPDYFAAMGVRLVAGRLFTVHDDASAQPAIIVNEALSRRFFANGQAVAGRLRVRGRSWDVVGVVSDAKHDDLSALGAPATMYTAIAQDETAPWTFLAVRVARDPASMIAAVRAAAQEVDRNVPAYDVSLMEDRLDGAVAGQRLNAVLLAVFGAVALALAAIGIYGVINYAVTLQTKEIGLRVALGARTADVLRLVVGQGARYAAAGIAAGVLAALVVTRVLTRLLYGVRPTDVTTFAGAALLLAAVALAACWIPGRRAARLDPIVALRQE